MKKINIEPIFLLEVLATVLKVNQIYAKFSCQGSLFLAMVFKIVNSFLIHATIVTL